MRRMKNRSASGRLCRVLLIAGLLCVAANCSSQPEVRETTQDKPAAAELVAQADKLYTQRAELARAREAILLLRRALGFDSNSYDAAWRLARLNYYLGAHTDNTSERDSAYNDGIEAGRRATKLQDGRPEGHFWLGANLGGKAQTSMMSGLSFVSEIRKEMQRVIQLDEGFQSGSAYMALGQIELETPRMLGGDSSKAVEILEKGLRFGEDNALYHLRLAQAYLAVNRKADARKQLEIIINSTPNPEFLPEHQEAVTEAKKLLEKTS
jgi:tetratricopeptide (TPR) repeat protein